MTVTVAPENRRLRVRAEAVLRHGGGRHAHVAPRRASHILT
ncbi:MAG TPA: hypothetical protein VGJ59_17950 [Jatrophihabitantaceae bacterium]|jgi:hypothetical protein